MRIAERLQTEFLAGKTIDPVEFSAATGYTRQAVTKALHAFGRLVKYDIEYKGWGVGRSSTWRCVDLPAMREFVAPALQRGINANAKKRNLADAPAHWQPLLHAWGLPIRPLDLVECEAHPHEQPMTGDDDEL